MSVNARADGPIDVPAIYRNSPDFYGAVGAGVSVSFTLKATSVAVGEGAAITLTVANAINPADVIRPPLESMPAFTSRFQVEAGPTKIDATTVSFSYVLRPREVGVWKIPRLRFAFYNPAAAAGKSLQHAYADSIVLTASPARRPAAVQPSFVPERFRKLVNDDRRTGISRLAIWLTVIAFTAVAIPAGLWLAGRYFPDAAHVARAKAFDRAKRKLAAARHSTDPAAVVAETVREFLAARPERIDEGIPPLFAACDEARFSRTGDNGLSLIARAERLIAGGGHPA